MLRQNRAIGIAPARRQHRSTRGHARHVEPCAKAPPLARKHHAAHVIALGTRVDRVTDSVEHRWIERVPLVGPGKGEYGDAIGAGSGVTVVSGGGDRKSSSKS